MRRTAVLLLVSFVSFPLCSSTLRAQQPQRIFNNYWQQLAHASSVDAARALPRPQLATAKSDSLVAAGLLELRSYELTLDRTHYMVGTQALQRSIADAPDDAWAHYAMGAMLARGPDVRSHEFAESNAYIVKKASDARVRAPRELNRALELNPSLDAAAFELATLALDLGDPPLIRSTLDLLDDPARVNKGKAYILASKLENRLYSPERAYRYVLQARAAGVDPSIAAHQQAVSMFRFAEPDDSAATAAYLAGIEQLTPEGAREYFAPIALLVSPDEAREWHSLDLEHRKAWLLHFWDKHSALAGTSMVRRIAEHYARLAKAEQYYGDVSGEEHYGVVVTADAAGQQRPGGLLSMLLGGKPHVVEENDQVTSLLRHGDLNRMIKYVTCEPGWDTLPVPLQPKAEACKASAYGQQKIRELNATSWNLAIKKATQGESFDPRYGKHINIATEVAQFRAADGGAEVVGVVGVPGFSAADLLMYTNDQDPVLTIALVDTTKDWIRRNTTTERTSANDFKAGWNLAYTVSTPAPAGHNVALRLGLENAYGTVGGVSKETINVESFDPSALTMSDVVIAPSGAIGSFMRGKERVALAPGHVYTTAEEPVLYYEVYGTAPDAELTTQVRVEPIRESALERMRSVLGRDDGSVTASFKERAPAPNGQFGVQQKRTIGLGQLVPDDYRITVTVTDNATGRSTSREKVIKIIASPVSK